MTTYESSITLIERGTAGRVVVPILDNSAGDLVPYRVSGRYVDVVNEQTKNGMLVLRSPFGLFDTRGPILTDEDAKWNYLIEVQLTQGSKVGSLFRYEIAASTVNESKSGKHISLRLMQPDIRLEQIMDSTRLKFLTPKQAFQERINYATENAYRAFTLTVDPAQNNLPNIEALRQNWYPTEPRNIKDHLIEIIRRVSSPEIIGSTNEDWYFDIHAVSNFSKNFSVTASRLGVLPVTPEELSVSNTNAAGTSVYEITKDTDNKKYRNIIIGKGPRGQHAFPMAYTRWASDMTHADVAAPWKSTLKYQKGDYVRHNDRGYKAKKTSTGKQPPATSSSGDWTNLVYESDYSPMTIRPSRWVDALDGKDNKYHYAGYFHDLNIVRRRYDPDNFENPYASVGVKDVNSVRNSPPTDPQHGDRYLVGSGTGAWGGRDNRVAQYAVDHWEYSDPPETDDGLNVRNTATTIRWNGSRYVNAWELGTNPRDPSVFFPVAAVELIKGRFGTVGKAVRFKFDWDWFETTDILLGVAENIVRSSGLVGIIYEGLNLSNFFGQVELGFREWLEDNGVDPDVFSGEFGYAADNADIKNLASRRYGWSFRAPFKDVILDHVMDFHNLDHSMADPSKKGWNQGIVSEDLGKIRAVEFLCRIEARNHSNQLLEGWTNMRQIFWFRDIADRIAIHRYEVRAHGQYQRIVIPCGADSNLEIYDSRIDDLWKILGFTISESRQTVDDRELTGVRFDWGAVVGMGTFSTDTYDDNLLYVGGQNAVLESIAQHAQQVAANLAVYTAGLIPLAQLVPDYIHYSLEDIVFRKDAYVSTADDPIEEPRMEVVRMPSDWDYVNMREIKAKRILSRRQYHPFRSTIYADGNVNIKAGERFMLKQQHVSKPVEYVATEVDHVEDHTGYHILVQAIRRYQVT